MYTDPINTINSYIQQTGTTKRLLCQMKQRITLNSSGRRSTIILDLIFQMK